MIFIGLFLSRSPPFSREKTPPQRTRRISSKKNYGILLFAGAGRAESFWSTRRAESGAPRTDAIKYNIVRYLNIASAVRDILI